MVLGWFQLQLRQPHAAIVRPPRASARRRSGSGGRVGPLDAATRTLEFESLGTKVRNTRRFLVLNPTSIAYEYSWEPAEVAGGGSNAQLVVGIRAGCLR